MTELMSTILVLIIVGQGLTALAVGVEGVLFGYFLFSTILGDGPI